MQSDNCTKNSSGVCPCQDKYSGRICDVCQVEYYDYPNCYDCNCKIENTISGTNTCNQTNGDCRCKENFTGRTCNECADEIFDFPNCKNCQGN